jgi:hypothetical protein
MHFYGIRSHFEAFRMRSFRMGSFSKKNFKRAASFKGWGADGLFGRKEGRGALILTGVENTAPF